jgi:hypothetical protein
MTQTSSAIIAAIKSLTEYAKLRMSIRLSKPAIRSQARPLTDNGPAFTMGDR